MKIPYKAIVFDYGGVLEFFSKNNPNRIAAELLNVPVETFRTEYFKHNYLSNVENMPWEEMFSKVVSIFSDSPETTKGVMMKINEDRQESHLNKELIEALPDLKMTGFEIGLFSNNTTMLRTKINNNGLLNYFDEIVISSEIGFQKPSKEAFEILFKKLGLKAEEVIFIDDAQKSLESAQEIGYTPIHFKDNKQLQSDLQKLGIELRLKS